MNPLKFVPVARAMAGLSYDPSTQVGAVILDDDSNILSTGFNGFPRGVYDAPARYLDRETKLKYISHAEANAVAQAARVGARLLGSTLVLTSLYPCSNCAKLIIQAGITRVFAPHMPDDSKWHDEKLISEVMFEEAGVEVVFYDGNFPDGQKSSIDAHTPLKA